MNDSNKLMSIGIALVALYLIATQSLYVINENQRGLLLKFGEIVKENIEPGLRFKIPLINEVKKIDMRNNILPIDKKNYLTKGKKRVSVDSYVIWKIIDPVKFYTTTSGGDLLRLSTVLSSPVDEGLRNKFSSSTIFELVSTIRKGPVLAVDGVDDAAPNSVDKAPAENTLVDNINNVAKAYGVKVIDIKVKSIELPEEVKESVYNRMRSEREKMANQYRSEGRAEATKTQAEADKEKTAILAGAFKKSESVKGDGDKQAALIYAEAYGKDPKFFEFYKSLTAYVNSFTSGNDVLVVEPEGSFFKAWNTGKTQK